MRISTMKVTVVTIVVGGLGTAPKSREKKQEELKIKEKFLVISSAI